MEGGTEGGGRREWREKEGGEGGREGGGGREEEGGEGVLYTGGKK